MTLTKADEKVIQKIKEGDRKVYPEQIYVDPAIAPGAFITLLSLMFLMVSVVFTATPGPVPFELALLCTIIGIIALVPGIIVWYYFRTMYSYLDMKRFQVALSITALELSNLGHKKVQAIISPTYPQEYEFLSLFLAIGPSNLLKRMKDVQWDSESLDSMVKQQEKFTYAMTGFVGALALFGGLVAIGSTALLSLMSGTVELFLLALSLFILFFGVVAIFRARRKLGALEKEEPKLNDSDAIPGIAESLSEKCSVEDVLSLIRIGYTHPIRILVVGTYSALEYTGREYYTGDGLAFREAFLLPSTANT